MRISFAGGGSDLPWFYQEDDGCVVSAAINKYMFISVHPHHDSRIQVKYSKTELVDRAEQVEHPVVRQVLLESGVTGVDITSTADIPAGTGLGSSCAFSVGLLNAMAAYTNTTYRDGIADMAKASCRIAMDNLGEPSGKQDAYASAFGGINMLTFHAGGRVNATPMYQEQGLGGRIFNNLILLKIGGSRVSSRLLHRQRERAPRRAVRRMVYLAQSLYDSLTAGDIDALGPILDEGWSLKKQADPQATTPDIDDCYSVARLNGATGGKILGAGGSGYLLLYCPTQEARARVRESLLNLPELPVALDQVGSCLIYHDGVTACSR